MNNDEINIWIGTNAVCLFQFVILEFQIVFVTIAMITDNMIENVLVIDNWIGANDINVKMEMI